MREKCSQRLAVASAPTGRPVAVTSCSVVVIASDPVVSRVSGDPNRSCGSARRARPTTPALVTIRGPGSAGTTWGRAGMTIRRQFVLDDVSRAIIEQLQEDGRRPYARIAAAVGLSEAAVRPRVQRLLDAG